MTNEWIDSFRLLYEQAKPTIEKMIEVNSEGQPSSPNNFIDSYSLLKSLHHSIKEYPKAPEKEYKKALKDFEKTTEMCLKASEMMVKMLDDINHNANTAARMHFASIVGYVNYANIYYDDFKKRLSKAGFFNNH